MAPDDVSREHIERWLNTLADCRASFDALGFHIGSVVLAQIEETRVRTAAERTYDQYLGEALREYLFLPRYWSAEVRSSLSSSARSAYLDFLQREIERGAFPGVARAQATGVLDPNFILYHRMPFSNRALEDEWRKKVAAQKRKEVAAIKERIGRIAAVPQTITTTKLVDLFEALTAALSFARVDRQGGREPRIRAAPIHESTYPIILEWTDIGLAPKHGNVQLHFITQRSNQKRIPIQAVVPGGDAYALNNMDWYSVALAIQTHLELLRLFTTFS